MISAQPIAEHVTKLPDSHEELLGRLHFSPAGGELHDAPADTYGSDEALAIIDRLGTIVGNARAHARKVAE